MEVLQAIARVRRAMPRNHDVMLICETLELMLISKQPEVPVTSVPDFTTFDKKAYQREYMRKRRAKK